MASLAGEKVYDQLFSLTDEAEMGHIRLSREADLVVVAPATADLMAKMAAGLADDLASTLLLASDKPVLIAPAMNPQMWAHPATRRNLARLPEDGVRLVGPNPGDMACGEVGSGRMAEPHEILAAIEALLAPAARPLAGLRALVTSGPTREPLDPVRYPVQPLVRPAGPCHRARPGRGRCGGHAGQRPRRRSPIRRASRVVHVETAREMLAAVEAALPADIAVCAAAVADWRPAECERQQDQEARGCAHRPRSSWSRTPTSCGRWRRHAPRPRLVVGFAAETGDLEAQARAKLARKGCDWILANDVSTGTGVFGGERQPDPAADRPTARPRRGRSSTSWRWPGGWSERIAATLAGSVADA